MANSTTTNNPTTDKRASRIKNFLIKFDNAVSPLGKNFWLFSLIIIAIFASQLTLFASPIVGVYITAGAIVALGTAALLKQYSLQLVLSGAIIPVALMINLSLPLSSVFAQTTVFYAALLVLGLIYRFVFTLDNPIEESRMSLRGYATFLPLMMIIGQLLGVLGYALLRHQYLYGHTSLPLVAATSVVFAIAEEVVFRGLIQQRASKIMHPIVAAMMSALLSFCLTIGHRGSWMTPLIGLIAGIVLATTYYKKQNLILTMTINISMKLAYVGLIAGFIFR
jgi:membrane protease YdiL (CAAX protease family)